MTLDQAHAIAQECEAMGSGQFLGLHFYFGSQRLSQRQIVEGVEYIESVMEMLRQRGLRLRIVDVGLGLGVPYHERDGGLDWVALREALHLRWRQRVWSGIELWSEAGRALVAECGYYGVRVLERKILGDDTFVFVDGGLHHHNPGLGLGRLIPGNPGFAFPWNTEAEVSERVHIVGMLCTSADCFGRSVPAPRLAGGDLVVIRNAGAYCLTTGMWGFIAQGAAAEYLLGMDGRLTRLRPQQDGLCPASPAMEGG